MKASMKCLTRDSEPRLHDLSSVEEFSQRLCKALRNNDVRLPAGDFPGGLLNLTKKARQPPHELDVRIAACKQ